MSQQTVIILNAVAATGAGVAIRPHGSQVTVQAKQTGGTSATLDIEGSLDGTNWDIIGTISLTTDTTDHLAFDEKWVSIRANLSAITGGAVTAIAAY